MSKNTELTAVGYQPTIAGKLRSLGSFEEFFWLIDRNRPVHFALAAEVEGETTIEQWRHALNLVQRRHPLLSVSIEQEDDSTPYFVRRSATPIPLRVIQGINITHEWELEVERELSQPFDPQAAPLIRAVLLHEESRAVCILAVHPSIADGRSIQYAIRDLLQVLAGESLETLPLLSQKMSFLGLPKTEKTKRSPGTRLIVRFKNRPPSTSTRIESARNSKRYN
jgi:hypothetical protein